MNPLSFWGRSFPPHQSFSGDFAGSPTTPATHTRVLSGKGRRYSLPQLLSHFQMGQSHLYLKAPDVGSTMSKQFIFLENSYNFEDWENGYFM